MAEDKEPRSGRLSTSSLAWAEWRRGLKDLQNAVLNPWNGVTQTHEETGTIATPTQAEITADKGTVYGYQNMLNDFATRSGAGRGSQERGVER